MNNTPKIIAIYTSRGDPGAFLMYPYLYNTQGEWIGWVTPQREVYSILGVFVGRLSNDPRILGKRVEEYTHPKRMPPLIPERIYPPASVPLAPLMPELSYDTVDILYEEPELLHTLDAGDLRKDLD
jgi:hypothetical protein